MAKMNISEIAELNFETYKNKFDSDFEKYI